MKYLICQEWVNTGNNHAGMKYLCHELSRRYPEDYVSICLPDVYNKYIKSNNKVCRKLKYLYGKYIIYQQMKNVANDLAYKLQEGDSVFLMEYLEKLTPQYIIARKIRSNTDGIKIYGLSHLAPCKLDVQINDKTFQKWIHPIDKTLTLGTSLSIYFRNRNISEDKVITLFHYVETDYYFKRNPIQHNQKGIRVIAMGNQMRNVSVLRKVLEDNPNVQFTICQGVSDMRGIFSDLHNVKLIPFVSEDELREEMETSDVSLNIMDDTIGSNVITTSLSMGLAMVVSDVGSIRNYCSEKNTIFCRNDLQAFSKAIQILSKNPELLYNMKINAIKESKKFSIENFHALIQQKNL